MGTQHLRSMQAEAFEKADCQERCKDFVACHIRVGGTFRFKVVFFELILCSYCFDYLCILVCRKDGGCPW